jgi:SPP1 family predicted phage head-tail adaptor
MKCCDMHAGMLREPVTFQEMARLSDGAGGFTQTWSTISGAPDRAHVKAMSGGERYASARTEASASWRIVCRYNANIDETKKAVIRGRSYQIRFVNNLELMDRWLEIDLDLGDAV